MKIITGDALTELKKLEEGSVHSIVTDPPYGLSFMGKDWDHGVPGVPFWEAALRVAKPGAFLLAFGGTRTFHRLACAIEDAGWEIRDTIMWVYGSGFPKSHNIGKAVDKLQGNKRRVEGTYKTPDGRDYTLERSCQNGYTKTELSMGKEKGVERRIITKGTSEWEGWGTALKPAWEPIIVARKPLIGTVAENVLKYETGGMNIDGCRIATDETRIGNVERSDCSQIAYGKGWQKSGSTPPAGRWPANLIHDGSDEVVGLFPVTKSGSIKPHKNAGSTFQSSKEILATTVGDSGSAARFFYCAKASKQDRGEGCEGMEAKEKHTRNSYGDQSEYDCPDGANRQGNKGTSIARNYHPTVKPTALMRYLCKLVTPPKGIVLDPFMGSGSTGKAALQEGFDFIGIDIDEEYANIAKARIHHITDLFTQPEAI